MYSDKYVYHGSNKYKSIADPKVHRRLKKVHGKQKIIFNDISFHATPYKWIALAYTYTPATFIINRREAYYNIGVDLYKNKNEIEIFGIESLEKSLKALYGNGGYLLSFKKESFYHCEGLGNLEHITQKEIVPISIDTISNPIYELQKRKIKFVFIDLNLVENSKHINFVE
jgi:hypothetical protein